MATPSPSVDSHNDSQHPGACDPYSVRTPSVSLARMLDRLTRPELENIALRFYGRQPERFEQILMELWAARA